MGVRQDPLQQSQIIIVTKILFAL